MTLDQRTFRNTLGLFATGVAVIAVDLDDKVHAMTANAVSAVSLVPMLVMFCPSKRARLAEFLPQVARFTINFLRADQAALSTYFAGGWKEPTPPPFKFVPEHHAPRLEGSLASMSCELHQIHDGGDHWLVIGSVTAIHHGIEPHRPLLFFKGKYRAIDTEAGTNAPALVDVTDEPAMVYYA
jgi:flavin reductase (DIM6/NTAB) family NADH-FMN oxidoreductase RutF